MGDLLLMGGNSCEGGRGEEERFVMLLSDSDSVDTGEVDMGRAGALGGGTGMEMGGGCATGGRT